MPPSESGNWAARCARLSSVHCVPVPPGWCVQVPGLWHICTALPPVCNSVTSCLQATPYWSVESMHFYFHKTDYAFFLVCYWAFLSMCVCVFVYTYVNLHHLNKCYIIKLVHNTIVLIWFQNETFVPFDVPMTKTFKRTCDTCHQSHSRGLTLIDEKGNFITEIILHMYHGEIFKLHMALCAIKLWIYLCAIKCSLCQQIFPHYTMYHYFPNAIIQLETHLWAPWLWHQLFRVSTPVMFSDIAL